MTISPKAKVLPVSTSTKLISFLDDTAPCIFFLKWAGWTEMAAQTSLNDMVLVKVIALSHIFFGNFLH